MTQPSRPTDGALLAEFLAGHGQAAFTELVNRHGAMVHGVALRVLADHHEAQDVTQAVFLTLARKATALRQAESVGGWLHTVAWRMAVDVQRSRHSRQRREMTVMREHPTTVIDHPEPSLFRAELDTALSQLPQRYCQPLVLFHLEAKSLEETALTLGLNLKTASTRLVRARELLRQKLVRRGVTVGSVGALTALLSAEAGAATLPATFIASTVGAATGTAAVSASVSALTQGALHMMFIAKLKTAALITAACVAVTGTGIVVAQQAAKQPTPTAVTIAQRQTAKTGVTIAGVEAGQTSESDAGSRHAQGKENNGLVAVPADARFPVQVNGKWGYISGQGTEVIPPQFDEAYEFHDGLARIQTTGDGVKRTLGYLGRNGQWAIVFPQGTPQWAVGAKKFSCSDFADGLAVVAKDGKHGYMNSVGQVVIDFQFAGAQPFAEGLAAVSLGEDRWGYINKSGTFVTERVYSWRAGPFSGGLARVQEDGGKQHFGFIDRTGKLVIALGQPRGPGDFHDGLAAVHTGNDKYGYINPAGQMVIPDRYDVAFVFHEGLACVRMNPTSAGYRWGYIDRQGNAIIPATNVWSVAYHFSDGLARFSSDGRRYGFIDRAGRVVIPERFYHAHDFQDGLAFVLGDDVPLPPLPKGTVFSKGTVEHPRRGTLEKGQTGGYIDTQGWFVWKAAGQ